MRSSLADLPMWVESLRYAAPPSLSSILADVQTRIRYTVWDPDDLRAVASLIMSLDSPDLHQRVVERIPDWFLTDDMDLIDLFAHPIPEIAAWSKQQAIEVGLPGRAILQLVESNRHHDLDLLVQVATKIPANDPDLTRCVTRLIGDSRSVVRQIGIDLLQLQRASLPSESTLHVLTESPHRTFWSLALSILEDTPDLVSRFPRFVESALRGRWATSRQRSMLIRTIEAVPQRHIETLLEIARLGWPIHQEWALRLLIDVEMAGINVPGFALIDRQGLDQ